MLTHNQQAIKISFSCPVSGHNYFKVENGIDGVTAIADWSTPGGVHSTSGHPVNATVKITKA